MVRLIQEKELAEVVEISSHPRWRRAYPCESYTLKQARVFLGGGYFRKALFEWSLDELRATIAHPECALSDAFDAYHAILRFRMARAHTPPPPPSNIIIMKRAA